MPDTYMAVGGGKANHYLVFICERNASFTEATNPSAPDGEIELVIGGQPGSHPLTSLVSLNDAIEAATHYLSTGEPAQGLAWEQRP